jgi:hypothetical protein
MPDNVRSAEVGVVTTIDSPGGYPCATSETALKELMKWRAAISDEKAPDSVVNELADALLRTRSIMISQRTQVRILAKGADARKISVLNYKDKYGSGYASVAAQGCWVAAKAVVRSPKERR